MLLEGKSFGVNDFESKFRRALLDILRSIQKSIHSVDEKYSADYSEQQPPSHRNLEVSVSVPPAIADHYVAENTDRPQKNTRDKIRLWVECIGLGAVITGGIFAYRTFCEVQRQAKAAFAQVDIMQKQLDASARPWVALEGTFTINDIQVVGLAGSATFATKNYGGTPAINAGLGMLFAPSSDFDDKGQQFRNFSDIACINSDNRLGVNADPKRGWGSLIVPNGIVQLRSGIVVMNRGPYPSTAKLQIVGCIGYASPLNSIRRHTRFCMISEKSAVDFRPGDKMFICPYGNTAD
jgi:hypothetical protein